MVLNVLQNNRWLINIFRKIYKMNIIRKCTTAFQYVVYYL